MVIDTELSGATEPASSLVRQAILDPLNRKIGVTCFSHAAADAPEIHVLFDGACTSKATIDRLETAPVDALPGPPADASVDSKLQPKVKT